MGTHFRGMSESAALGKGKMSEIGMRTIGGGFRGIENEVYEKNENELYGLDIDFLKDLGLDAVVQDAKEEQKQFDMIPFPSTTKGRRADIL